MTEGDDGLVLTTPGGGRFHFDPGALCLELLTTGGPGPYARYEVLHRPADLAVRSAGLPAGRPFAWLAGEAGAVRALRRHLVEERGVPKASIDFTGYWRHRLTQDDAPTAEDLADAQERLAGY
nr:SIP domain-containing protein [Streptomyces sp. CBMA156]